MKILCLLFLLAAQATWAHHNPITSFEPGTYFGKAKYTTSHGKNGGFISYMDMDSEKWELIYFRDNGIGSFRIDFHFTKHGFFRVTLTEKKLFGRDKKFPGRGYCGTHQCKIFVEMGDRFLEETISFDYENKKIRKLGSLHTIGPEGETHTIIWREILQKFWKL